MALGRSDQPSGGLAFSVWSPWTGGRHELARPFGRPRGVAGVNVLLDTNVLSEPMRERPDALVMAGLEQGGHSRQTLLSDP